MKYIANPVEVEAQKITAISHPPMSQGCYTLTLEDGATFEPDGGMTARMAPQVGDYVVTQSDGYVYLNPKDVFERKYHSADGVIEIDENGKVTGPAGSEEFLANIAAIRQASL